MDRLRWIDTDHGWIAGSWFGAVAYRLREPRYGSGPGRPLIWINWRLAQARFMRIPVRGLIQVNPRWLESARHAVGASNHGLTWVMAAARAWWSAAGHALTTMATEVGTMLGELQWEGFASVADSGIREALYAAGVDCAMSACREPECIAGPGLDAHDPPIP